jgi:hypothetical protein
MKFKVTDILFSEFEELETDEEPEKTEEPEELLKSTVSSALGTEPKEPEITSTWKIQNPEDAENNSLAPPPKKQNIKKIVKRMTDQIKQEYEEKNRIQKEQILDEVKEQIRLAVPSVTSGVSGVVVGGSSSLSKENMLDIYDFGARSYGTATVQPNATKVIDVIQTLPNPPASYTWSFAIKTFGNMNISFEIQTYFNGLGIEYNISNMVGDFLDFTMIPSLNANKLILSIQNDSNKTLEIKFKRKY